MKEPRQLTFLPNRILIDINLSFWQTVSIKKGLESDIGSLEVVVDLSSDAFEVVGVLIRDSSVASDLGQL